jgi:4-hydroxybenzoate polyprenyltransferase
MFNWLRRLNQILVGFHSLGFLLSIGGVVCLKFFDVISYNGFKSIQFPQMWICGTLIFTVYLIDHLRDLNVNVRLTSELEIVRKFKWVLIPISIIGFMISILLVHKLDDVFITLGIIAFVLTVIYFLGLKFLPFRIMGRVKELWVALVISFAIAYIPMASNNTFDMMPILFFFLICFQSTLLFSWIDYQNDKLNQKGTLATQMGLEFVAWFFDILMLVHIALLADTAHSEGLSNLILAMFIMQMMLLAVRIYLEKKGSKPVLRFWADSVFVVPLVFI